MFCQTKLKIYKYENYKNGKNWLRIDSHRSQSPMRFNVFKFFFFKAVYVGIFRDSSSIAFHKFDAAYLHYLKPKVVDFTSGRSKYCGSSWGCKWSALLLWDHVSLQVLHHWLISQKQWTMFSLIVVHEDLRDRYAYKGLHEARTYLWKQNWALVCPPSLTCQRTSYYRSVTFRNSN